MPTKLLGQLHEALSQLFLARSESKATTTCKPLDLGRSVEARGNNMIAVNSRKKSFPILSDQGARNWTIEVRPGNRVGLSRDPNLDDPSEKALSFEVEWLPKISRLEPFSELDPELKAEFDRNRKGFASKDVIDFLETSAPFIDMSANIPH